MKTSDELRAELAQYIGTENYFYNPFNKRVLYTDGVKFFLEEAAAYWLLELIILNFFKKAAARCEKDQNEEEFFIIEATAQASSGKVVMKATDEDGEDFVVCEQTLDFTTLPEGTWKFYFHYSIEKSILLLPSEY